MLFEREIITFLKLAIGSKFYCKLLRKFARASQTPNSDALASIMSLLENDAISKESIT